MKNAIKNIKECYEEMYKLLEDQHGKSCFSVSDVITLVQKCLDDKDMELKYQEW